MPANPVKSSGEAMKRVLVSAAVRAPSTGGGFCRASSPW
jgi:hypothetical protein